MTTPEIGDQAPDLALPDETATVHRLADRRGRWTIVYFYPKDDTPGCTIEACQFRDLHDRISDPADGGRAVIWGISPDGAASHRRFREKFDLPYTLLSDEDHGVAIEWGAWRKKQQYGREYEGVARSTYLVDPAGRIAQAWPTVHADGHAAAVLEALAAARSAWPSDPDAAA